MDGLPDRIILYLLNTPTDLKPNFKQEKEILQTKEVQLVVDRYNNVLTT